MTRHPGGEDSLYQRNLRALSKHSPESLQKIENLRIPIRLFERPDGYSYAQCSYQGQTYFISRDENISLELLEFRREIREAVEQGADLLFLLGAGLGYRVRAAWETVERMKSGFLVVLEQEPALLDAACRCSDLREVLASPRCRWIVGPLIEKQLALAVRDHHWFGARKSLFFWGYQTTNRAATPLYEPLIEQINLTSRREQEHFLRSWNEWNQRRASAAAPVKAALLYETELGQPVCPAELNALRAALPPDRAERPTARESFTASTAILQWIMEQNPNEIHCLGFVPEKWIPPHFLTVLNVHYHAGSS